jgi:hypothetical protein
MQRATVKLTRTICREYWGLSGTVGPDRCTAGWRRNHIGDVVAIETEPTCVIEFDVDEEFLARSKARGAVGLSRSLSLPVSALVFS